MASLSNEGRLLQFTKYNYRLNCDARMRLRFVAIVIGKAVCRPHNIHKYIISINRKI